jgi:hypothetical protein
MHIDHDAYKYNEYACGYKKEIIVDTKIPNSNEGFGIPMRSGWVGDGGWGFLAVVSSGRARLGDRKFEP